MEWDVIGGGKVVAINDVLSFSSSLEQQIVVTEPTDETGMGLKPVFKVGMSRVSKKRKVNLKKRVVGAVINMKGTEVKDVLVDDQLGNDVVHSMITKRKSLDSNVDMEDSERMLKRSCVENGTGYVQSKEVAVVGYTQPREQQ